MWDAESPRPQPPPEPDWAGWDPALTPDDPGEVRFVPSRRSKTIIAVIVAVAMVVTVIALCVAAKQLLGLI